MPTLALLPTLCIYGKTWVLCCGMTFLCTSVSYVPMFGLLTVVVSKKLLLLYSISWFPRVYSLRLCTCLYLLHLLLLLAGYSIGWPSLIQIFFASMFFLPCVDISLRRHMTSLPACLCERMLVLYHTSYIPFWVIKFKSQSAKQPLAILQTFANISILMCCPWIHSKWLNTLFLRYKPFIEM